MVRRKTNPIRRDVAASLHAEGEAWNTLYALEMADKATYRRIKWLGTEHWEGCVR